MAEEISISRQLSGLHVAQHAPRERIWRTIYPKACVAASAPAELGHAPRVECPPALLQYILSVTAHASEEYRSDRRAVPTITSRRAPFV